MTIYTQRTAPARRCGFTTLTRALVCQQWGAGPLLTGSVQQRRLATPPSFQRLATCLQLFLTLEHASEYHAMRVAGSACFRTDEIGRASCRERDEGYCMHMGRLTLPAGMHDDIYTAYRSSASLWFHYPDPRPGVPTVGCGSSANWERSAASSRYASLLPAPCDVPPTIPDA